MSATDIFTLNAAFGATIENQVVATLNAMRTVWDPENEYLQYSFVRQAQTFPDVLFRRTSGSDTTAEPPLLGIELKGWYLLAKEGEPSFRFSVTPKACAVQDLIVVVPWALTNVISGSPIVFTPYVESARHAAELRNYHWSYLRATQSNATITQPPKVGPYPKKSDAISDVPGSDNGGNFGRFARTGIMDNYLALAKRESLAGIRAEHWLGFFKLFQDQKLEEEIAVEIEKLRKKFASDEVVSNDRFVAAHQVLANIERMLA